MINYNLQQQILEFKDACIESGLFEIYNHLVYDKEILSFLYLDYEIFVNHRGVWLYQASGHPTVHHRIATQRYARLISLDVLLDDSRVEQMTKDFLIFRINLFTRSYGDKYESV